MPGCGSRPFYSKEEKKTGDGRHGKNADSTFRKANAAGRSPADSSGCSPARCAPRKKMLLLDEPVSGLDPKADGRKCMHSFKSSITRDGITVVMISHDLNAALQYASHILHIGEVSFSAPRRLT